MRVLQQPFITDLLPEKQRRTALCCNYNVISSKASAILNIRMLSDDNERTPEEAVKQLVHLLCYSIIDIAAAQ